ncbi:hypothetical protein D3C72_2146010 [compost metagenome]
MSLKHVAQHPLRHRLGHLGRQRGIGQRILGGERQGMALLSRREQGVAHYALAAGGEGHGKLLGG